MQYDEAIQRLVRAGVEAETPIAVQTPDAGESFYRTVFGDPLSDAIKASGYPGGVELPWSAEELYLYGLEELNKRQEGYRHDANTGDASSGWDEDRYVIADWAANPVSITGDGSISYARHGEGSWSHIRIAADLPGFFAMLAAWLHYFVVEHNGNLFDENFEIAAATRDDLRRLVVADTAPEDREAAINFLLGEI
ncbi:hypothetical protein [Sphingomonas sp. ERG5]|uniref:hypothetical protein n=1 Tax=Sphingomonas sp. ERG5 TaxID=1381597 RepID=UPI000B0253B8|nr:hypothetical protein [Sphingomonas sp. ERG5]